MLTLPNLFRDAITALLRQRGISAEKMADECGLGSAASVRRYAEEGETGTLSRVLSLVMFQAQHGDPRVLREMARRSGHLLVEAPIAASAGSATIRQIAATLHAATASAETFASAIEDGKVTSAEMEALEAAVSHAQEQLGGLLVAAQHCREGAGPAAAARTAAAKALRGRQP